jgi:fluoroacetyl-CoA thioesterase
MTGNTAPSRSGTKDEKNDRNASGAAMKPGMTPGQTATVAVIVDATMFATFEGQVVHPVYGTAAMIAHMELAGRRIILPYLEPHEEGVGYAIDVRHLAPTVAGMRVTARATLTEVRGNRVVCRVESYNERGRIGEGTFTQVILNRTDLEGRIIALQGATSREGSDARHGAPYGEEHTDAVPHTG